MGYASPMATLLKHNDDFLFGLDDDDPQEVQPLNHFGVGGDTTDPTEDAFPQSTPSVPQFLPQKNINRWPPQLVLDLALGLDGTEAILNRYNLTPGQLDRLYEIQSFRTQVAAAGRELRENGMTFKRKAAAQAESYLETIDGMMLDPDTPAGVRLEVFKTVAKYGELEPKESKQDQGNQNNIQVNINF